MKTAILACALSVFAIPLLAQEPSTKIDGGREEKTRKEAPQDPREEHFAKMKHEINELQRAGKKEEAERLAQQLRAEFQASRGDGGQPCPEGPERLRHLQEAIKHLRAAGLDQPARDLETMAGKMREEFERANQGGRGGGGDGNAPMREMQRQLQETREQVRQLGEEVQRLRESARRDHPERQ